MLLPSAVAFNCNSLSGGDNYVCNQIQGMSISSTEKDLLISDLFNKNKTIPNFDFIYSWNTNLNIPAPSNGQTYSSGTIRSAWIEIVSLMPSVLENETLYASNNGKLLTAYNYQYSSLPSGTESGDCATYYSWSSQTSSLNIYLNNNWIGNNKLTAYQIYNSQDNLNFLAKLSITAKYKVEHYKSERYCSRRDSYGYCIRYSYRCRYSSTEYRTDTLNLEDGLNAKLYKNQLSSNFKITDKYFNITKGTLQADNYTRLSLSFNNSDYQENNYIYSLDYALPYYVLTLKAEKIPDNSLRNINIYKENNSILFTVKDSSNCKIQLFDHFNSLTQNCDLSFNEINLSIRTDKTDYYENDTIKVLITPNNVFVNLSYANQTVLAKNYTEFKAVLYENKINAKLNEKEVNWLVNVKKKENSVILYNLGVLSFIGYFFYKAGKAYLLNLI